jgi:hypothetical protein
MISMVCLDVARRDANRVAVLSVSGVEATLY